MPPGQEHPLAAMAQNYERMCAEMLSRPPYNTDAILAQQVSGLVTLIGLSREMLFTR